MKKEYTRSLQLPDLHWMMFYMCISVVAALLLFSSCRKFVEVDQPKDQVVSPVAFSSDAAALSTIAGLYSQMMASNYFLANGGITITAGLSADELVNRISSANDNVFYQNSIPATNELVLNTRLWGAAYKSIYHANSILEGLAESSGLTFSLKQQLSGEARFIRAFFYFYLVNLFGEVPLVTSTDYSHNRVLPRASRDLVYGQIVSDLTSAESELSVAYPSAGRLRVNRWAATALLARVYLYQKNWEGAEAAATAVLNSGSYLLEPDLEVVFTPGSREVIWQLLPVSGSLTPIEAQAFLPAASATARPQYLLTADAVDAFEDGDQRRVHWVQSKVVGGAPNYYSSKYRVKVPPASDPVEYNVVLRLAEQYLIRAEARAQLGDLDGARSDLDAIRNRADLPGTTAADQENLLHALETERRVEFLAEWGHRWLDLKRWERADAVLGVAKAPNWQPTDALYPVPLSELKRNPLLTQNPGY